MPFGVFKESKERKYLKKIIQNKDTTPAEGYVIPLLKMMDDEVSKRVVVHNLIKYLEKGLDEKKYVRALCLVYRLMDVDSESFLLDQFSIKENMIMNTLPKGAAKSTKVFAKHLQLKVDLYNNYQVVLSAENEVQEIHSDEDREDAFEIIDLLISMSENIQESDFQTKNIQFHVTDILLLELTILFLKINCYSSILANVVLTMNIEETEKFIEIIKRLDKIRHVYFTILQKKEIKEKFEELPKLSFMPTGPLQTFLNKRIQKKKQNDISPKIDKEIETFNLTFQSDIVSNNTFILSFINRPLISINDGEAMSESLSRSVSRSASSMDPTHSYGNSVGNSLGNSVGFSRGKQLTPNPHGMNSPHDRFARTPRENETIHKPIAKRANSQMKDDVRRPTSSFVFMDDSDEE